LFYTTNALVRATIGASNATPSTLDPLGVTYNSYACAAFGNKQVDSTTNKTKLTVVALESAQPAQYESWWCSNGLFNQASASGNYTKNVATVIPDNANQRMELALVGCPQLGKLCGAKAVAMIDMDSVSSAASLKVNMNKTMGYADKCTWMTYAKLHNPTFVLGKGANASTSSDTLGIYEGASQTWILHHMEYNDEQIPAASGGYIVTNTQALPTAGKGLDEFGRVP
jgi:hypothetical protein